VPAQPQRAVLWEGEGVTDLGTLGGVFGLAKGINDRGQVVGSSSLASGEEHAFLWGTGVMTDLGTLGGDFSLANRINHRGEVVGLSRTSDGELHAVVWRNSIAIDLNTLIPADSGWVLVEATDINRGGEIVGVGTINGDTRAFFLTPAEEHGDK
jgi:probable HAF family extracellular repeat protein